MWAIQRLAFTVALATGCTALSNFDVTQCDVDADCQTFDGPVRHCERSECVDGCSSNSQCSNVDPRSPVCPERGGPCAPLITDDGACYWNSEYDDASMGPLVLRDVLMIGAFAPDVKSSTWLSLQLASEELNAEGGIVLASGERRPLLLLLCESALSTIEETSAHLMTRLGAPAVVAGLESTALSLALARQSTAPATLYLSPYTADPEPSGPGLDAFWSLGAPYSKVVGGYGEVIQRVANAAVRAGADRALLRVAIVVGPAREDEALANAVVGGLQLDGKGTAALDREGRYRSFGFVDESPEQQQEQLLTLAAFRPDLVLVFVGGASEAPSRIGRASILRRIEGLVEAPNPPASPASIIANPASWRPRYILGPRNISDDEVRRLALSNESFRANAVGLTADMPADVGIVGPLVSRFEQAYPAARGDYALDARTYDAVYYLAYAIAAARGRVADVTLPAADDSLHFITDPASLRVDVGPGPERLGRASELLALGARFDLHGSTGAANFDETHARSGDVRVYCWNDAGEIETLATLSGPDGQLQSVRAGGSTALCGSEALDLDGM